MGQDALLRTSVACKVPLDRGVEIVGQYGELPSLRSVATFDRSLAPAPGDTLHFVASGEDYTLDALVKDDGYTVKFTLLEA